jgi:hypothetical protein
LNRGHTDAARSAVQQRGFARLELAAIEHIVPDGEVILRDARRFKLVQ